MAENYQNILNDIKGDRFSGAWVVARKAIKCMEALIKETGGSSVEELKQGIDKTAQEILKAQPGMAQLTNFFNTVLDTAESSESGGAVVLRRKLSGEVRRFYEQCTGAVARVAEFGAELIDEDSQVFVHSNSSTILEIIANACHAGKTFQVILTESRPGREGQAFAIELSKMGVACSYFVDATAAKGMERADVVLLGADSLSEVLLVNKAGSKAICLLARELVVPCYAACESSKFLPKALGQRKEKPRDPDEVWAAPPEEVTVENYYFDEISAELFTGVITEEGVLTPDEIGSRILSQKMNKRLLEMLK